MKTLLVVVASLLLTTSAWASSTEDALEYLYEAADVLDKAEAAFAQTQTKVGGELLLEAKDHLERAEALAPKLPRVAFERARMHLLAGKAAVGEAALTTALRRELTVSERVRGVAILDRLRREQARPTVGEEWATASGVRDAGAMMLGVGVSTFLAGVAVAFDSYVRGASTKIDSDAIAINRFGWALAGVGGGLTLGGGGMTLVGSLRLGSLRPLLPGPWHLPNAPGGVTLTFRGPLPEFSAPLALRVEQQR
jgi:hypothetical protein